MSMYCDRCNKSIDKIEELCERCSAPAPVGCIDCWKIPCECDDDFEYNNDDDDWGD